MVKEASVRPNYVILLGEDNSVLTAGRVSQKDRTRFVAARATVAIWDLAPRRKT